MLETIIAIVVLVAGLVTFHDALPLLIAFIGWVVVGALLLSLIWPFIKSRRQV